MDEAGRAPPAGLAFPRRQPWLHYPVLELDLSSVPNTGAQTLICTVLAPALMSCHIYCATVIPVKILTRHDRGKCLSDDAAWVFEYAIFNFQH